YLLGVPYAPSPYPTHHMRLAAFFGPHDAAPAQGKYQHRGQTPKQQSSHIYSASEKEQDPPD
ncbi:MAG: hypothetical protein V3R80_08785, partial [Candidatus Tectomicrobia bacterium]